MKDTVSIKNWLDEDFSSEEITDFRSNGFDLEEAIVIKSHGLTATEARGIIQDMDN
jgi:hypothetical protein